MAKRHNSISFEWVGPAQAIGLLGPGPTDVHIAHALSFVDFVENLLSIDGEVPFGQSYADLGTGGGFPGLIFAQLGWVSVSYLVEARVRRAEFLSEWVGRLDLSERARVECERAENLGRGALRESVSVVTARAFGSPAVTAECGSAMLRSGGVLVVSDPPGGSNDGEARWPSSGISLVKLEVTHSGVAPHAFSAMRKTGQLSDLYPRRSGVPERKPLF